MHNHGKRQYRPIVVRPHNPCGIKEFSVTSLRNEKVEASMSEVVEKVPL